MVMLQHLLGSLDDSFIKNTSVVPRTTKIIFFKVPKTLQLHISLQTKKYADVIIPRGADNTGELLYLVYLVMIMEVFIANR